MNELSISNVAKSSQLVRFDSKTNTIKDKGLFSQLAGRIKGLLRLSSSYEDQVINSFNKAIAQSLARSQSDPQTRELDLRLRKAIVTANINVQIARPGRKKLVINANFANHKITKVTQELKLEKKDELAAVIKSLNKLNVKNSGLLYDVAAQASEINQLLGKENSEITDNVVNFQKTVNKQVKATSELKSQQLMRSGELKKITDLAKVDQFDTEVDTSNIDQGEGVIASSANKFLPVALNLASKAQDRLSSLKKAVADNDFGSDVISKNTSLLSNVGYKPEESYSKEQLADFCTKALRKLELKSKKFHQALHKHYPNLRAEQLSS